MVTPAEEAQRVRGYLVAQAAKLSIADLVTKLQRDTVALYEASSAVPPGRFDERPAEGEWTAAEVWSHVLDMNDDGARAIEAILDGAASPAGIADRMDGSTREGLRTTDDYWRAFNERRDRLYERVLRSAGDEHLDVTINHDTFGALNWREWLLFMRVHDLDHARQLQAIAAAVSA